MPRLCKCKSQLSSLDDVLEIHVEQSTVCFGLPLPENSVLCPRLTQATSKYSEVESSHEEFIKKISLVSVFIAGSISGRNIATVGSSGSLVSNSFYSAAWKYRKVALIGMITKNHLIALLKIIKLLTKMSKYQLHAIFAEFFDLYVFMFPHSSSRCVEWSLAAL